MSSPLSQLFDAMKDMQIAQMFAQGALSGATSNITDAQNELQYTYLQKIDGPNDPNYAIEQQVLNNNYTGKGVTGIHSWAQKYLTDKNISIFSSAFMVDVLNAVVAWIPAHKGSTGQALLSFVSEYSSEVKAQGQADTQKGENWISTLGRLSQFFTNNQGPLSNTVSTIAEAFSSYSSAIQEISA